MHPGFGCSYILNLLVCQDFFSVQLKNKLR